MPIHRRLCVLVGATAAVALIIWCCWVVDDAYITLRMIDNAVKGYGLRWNVDERVQAFTHPLWTLCLFIGYWVTREPYYTSLLMSVAISAATIYAIGTRLAADWIATLLALAVLMSSRAFVAFSASNLENPLAHALIVLFAALYFRGVQDRRRLIALALVAGLLLLVRTDLAVLIGPAMAMRLWRQKPDAPRALAVAVAPALAWMAVSVVYYGFPFPNTAYAKLGHGVPLGEQLIQGLSYLLESLVMDPLTLLGCLAVIALTLRRRERDGWPVAAGIFLYVMYVVRIGGDYMSGRFLAAPFLLSVLVLLLAAADLRVQRRRLALLVCIGVVAAASRYVVTPATRLAFLRQHFQDDDPKWNMRRARATFRYIIDPRGDGATSALFSQWKNRRHELQNEWVALGRRLARGPRQPFAYGAVGLVGFYAGPYIHIIDAAALGDPLLARLPAMRPWFVGHYDRRVPPGYYETLDKGVNVIEDPKLRAYYDDVMLVTRGPIWSAARFKAIVRLNLGRTDGLLADYGALDVEADEQGGAWSFTSESGTDIWERGLRLRMKTPSSARRVTLVMRDPLRYELRYYASGRLLASQRVDVPDYSKQPVSAPVPLGAGVSFDRVDLLLMNDGHPATVHLLRFSD